MHPTRDTNGLSPVHDQSRDPHECVSAPPCISPLSQQLSDVVSDTAIVNPKRDKSTSFIQSTLQSEPGFDCRQHFTVAKDASRIQDIVRKICEQGVIDWLITTGGTGFGPQDVTPEVMRHSPFSPLYPRADLDGRPSFP